MTEKEEAIKKYSKEYHETETRWGRAYDRRLELERELQKLRSDLEDMQKNEDELKAHADELERLVRLLGGNVWDHG